MKTLSATSSIEGMPVTLAVSKSLSTLLLLSSVFSMVVWLLADLPFSTKPFQAEAIPLPIQNMHQPILGHPFVHKIQRTLHAAHKRMTRHSVKPLSKEVDFNSASLHSNSKHYTYLFTGTVSCGSSPCLAGDITVRLTSQHNDGITRQGTIQRDGTYQIRIPLDETPKQQVDWVITAKSGSGEPMEQGGRQILTNDSEVPIETTLNLQE